MSTQLTLQTFRDADGAAVMRAIGEIDQSNIAQFDKVLSTTVSDNTGSGRRVVVDLCGVTYLDSAAINVLYGSADEITLIIGSHLTRVLAVSGVSELVSIETRSDS